MCIISSLFFKFKVILLVVFISPCAHLLIHLYLYCAVPSVNAKYALSDDMACLLSVNGPTWFPIIIYLSLIITILSIYSYWIKLLLMFIFWCFACWLLILHKHFIFIHRSASLTLTWMAKGLGAAYADGSCWEVRVLFILVLFNCVL